MLQALKNLLLGTGPKAKAEAVPAAAPAPVRHWIDRALPIQGFDRIEADGDVMVQWTPGSASCVATVDELDPESGSLTVEVVGGALRVGIGAQASSPARLVVSSKALRSFQCSGAASGVALGIDAEIFEAALADGQRLMLTGKAMGAKLRLTGKGHMQADGLLAHTVIAKVDGPGILEAKAESVAEVSIAGGGEAIVFGDPKVSRVERVGDGRAQIGSKIAAGDLGDESGIFGQLPIPRS